MGAVLDGSELAALSVQDESLVEIERFVVLSPFGNTTAVAFGQLAPDDFRRLDARIRTAWRRRSPSDPAIEQVCIVGPARSALGVCSIQMLGDEFCGNATCAVAGYVSDQVGVGFIDVPGVGALQFAKDSEETRLWMPLDEPALQLTAQAGGLVRFPGTWQFVLFRRFAGGLGARAVLDRIRRHAPANASMPAGLGAVVLDERTMEAEFSIWVDALDNYYADSACGTGSAAVGIMLAALSGEEADVRVFQPCGSAIRVSAVYDHRSGHVVEASIYGRADVLYEGSFVI